MIIPRIVLAALAVCLYHQSTVCARAIDFHKSRSLSVNTVQAQFHPRDDTILQSWQEKQGEELEHFNRHFQPQADDVLEDKQHIEPKSLESLTNALIQDNIAAKKPVKVKRSRRPTHLTKRAVNLRRLQSLDAKDSSVKTQYKAHLNVRGLAAQIDTLKEAVPKIKFENVKYLVKKPIEDWQTFAIQYAQASKDGDQTTRDKMISALKKYYDSQKWDSSNIVEVMNAAINGDAQASAILKAQSPEDIKSQLPPIAQHGSSTQRPEPEPEIDWCLLSIALQRMGGPIGKEGLINKYVNFNTKQRLNFYSHVRGYFERKRWPIPSDTQIRLGMEIEVGEDEDASAVPKLMPPKSCLKRPKSSKKKQVSHATHVDSHDPPSEA